MPDDKLPSGLSSADAALLAALGITAEDIQPMELPGDEAESAVAPLSADAVMALGEPGGLRGISLALAGSDKFVIVPLSGETATLPLGDSAGGTAASFMAACSGGRLIYSFAQEARYRGGSIDGMSWSVLLYVTDAELDTRAFVIRVGFEGGAPVIFGEEEMKLGSDAPSLSGSVAAQQADALSGGEPAPFAPMTGAPGSYGTLSMDEKGHYTYVLDMDNFDVQFLLPGESLTDRFPFPGGELNIRIEAEADSQYRLTALS